MRNTHHGKRRPRPPYLFDDPLDLQGANVFSLPALLSFGHSEFNRLTLLKAAIAIRLDRGEVDENVLSILTCNKTEALCGVEPLNCSLFHFVSLSYCFDLTLE